MIQITPHMRILVATEPVDFRKGIDGLSRICRESSGNDPFSGTLFVFFNRQRTSLRILSYDGQGFWLCQKRLSSGRFKPLPEKWGEQQFRALVAIELQTLLYNGDLKAIRVPTPWRSIQAA